MEGALTVLAADDDPAMRELYGHWLEGHDLRLAADGRAALEAFDGSVDIVCLDREMPGPGPAGVRLATELTAGTRDAHVVLVSSLPDDVDLAATPVDQYIQKPVDREDIERVFSTHRTRRQYRDALEEYFALTAELGALEANCSPTQLETGVRYADLRERVAAKREEVDEILRAGDTDWAAAFSSLAPVEVGDLAVDRESERDRERSTA